MQIAGEDPQFSKSDPKVYNSGYSQLIHFRCHRDIGDFGAAPFRLAPCLGDLRRLQESDGRVHLCGRQSPAA